MRGGAGNDTCYVHNAGDKVVEGAGGGTADWIAARVSYTIAAGVEVERLTTTGNGGTSAIDLTGNQFVQAVTGNAGNNRINGPGGADTMTGLGGNDTYYVDNVGDKKFVFDKALNASTNIDRITDDNVAADTIRLENAIFTQMPGTGVLTAAQFVSDATGVAHDANDRVIYETDTGKLFYDSNGSAAGGSIQFATLTAGLALTNGDFFVI